MCTLIVCNVLGVNYVEGGFLEKMGLVFRFVLVSEFSRTFV
jgi:hypothetical protein